MISDASVTNFFFLSGDVLLNKCRKYIPTFFDVRVQEGHHIIKVPPFYFGGNLSASEALHLPPAFHECVPEGLPLPLPVSAYRDDK